MRRGNPTVSLISFWCLVIPLAAAGFQVMVDENTEHKVINFATLEPFNEPAADVPWARDWLHRFPAAVHPSRLQHLRAHDANDGAQGTLTVAAEDPATGSLILVTVNDTTGQRSVTYNLGKVGISEGSVKAYRTTLAGNIEATHQDLPISSSSFEDAQQPGQLSGSALGDRT